MSGSDRARIGMSTYRETAAWGAWNVPAHLLPATYAAAIRAGGGLPLLLPPGAQDCAGEAADAVASVDGLLLTGGPDVDPARYGASRDERTDVPRVDRDEWEIALVTAALAAKLPVLAVCRGLQILNVALGGSLHQHLPDVVGHDGHRGVVGSFVPHVVTFAAGSLLSTIYDGSLDVPTHHHQGIDRLGNGLLATAWTEDGLVEAVAVPGHPWLMGVQWHPEQAGGTELFAAFVAAAAQHRAHDRSGEGRGSPVTAGPAPAVRALPEWSQAVFSPVPVRNAFEVTVERLASAIRLGVLAAGDKLPSERDLAEQLGVSRMTLREAIKALREVGLVESRRGRSGGTFVQTPPPSRRRRGARQIGRSMGADLQDALDMRRIVEPGAAELAATRRLGLDEIAALRTYLAESHSAGAATRRIADSRLHMAIAAAAGSPSLSAAVAQVQLTLDELLCAIPVLATNIAHSDVQHERIVGAIAAGNAELARGSMCEHVDGTAALLIGLIG